MVSLGRRFAPKQDDGPGEFSLLPDGWYQLVVATTETRQKPGKPPVLSIVFEIDKDSHADLGARKFWSYMNLWNENPKAVEIAEREMSALVYACEVEDLEDTEDLHGRRFCGKVITRKGTGGYKDQNQVIAFRRSGESAPKSDFDEARPNPLPDSVLTSDQGGRPPWAKH